MRSPLLSALTVIWVSALTMIGPLQPTEAPGESPEILRGPYLQASAPHRATLIWESNTPTKAAVVCSCAKHQSRRWQSRVAERHTVILGRLRPGGRCRYAIYSAGRELARGYFRSPARRAGRRLTRFAVIGDSGSGSEAQFSVARELEGWRPHFVLHTGDVVYPKGERADYQLKFFSPYAELLRRSPFFPSLGNHDALNPDVYLDYFVLPAQRSFSGSERYYAFDWNGLHFIALDTNLDYASGSPQYRWLIEDLRNRTAGVRWTVVFFHHPPFSSGPHGDSISVQTALVPVFEEYGVDLVLSGHDHAYERFVPLRRSASPGSTVQYLVTGGGGASLYQRASVREISAMFASQHHFVAITANRRRLQIQAVSADGTILDEYFIEK